MRRAALMGGQEVADWYIAATAIGDIQSRRYPKGIPKGSKQGRKARAAKFRETKCATGRGQATRTVEAREAVLEKETLELILPHLVGVIVIRVGVSTAPCKGGSGARGGDARER